MSTATMDTLFSDDVLAKLFPKERANEFFDALFGDAEEGAYDIVLQFKEHNAAQNTLLFALELHERPGKCLACNLTHGLPEVFSRHPLLDIQGVVNKIDTMLGDAGTCRNWRLGPTRTVSKALHVVPLTITLA